MPHKVPGKECIGKVFYPTGLENLKDKGCAISPTQNPLWCLLLPPPYDLLYVLVILGICVNRDRLFDNPPARKIPIRHDDPIHRIARESSRLPRQGMESHGFIRILHIDSDPDMTEYIPSDPSIGSHSQFSKAKRVREGNRVVPHIAVQVHAAYQSDRILGEETVKPRRKVPPPVVVKAGRAVVFPAGELEAVRRRARGRRAPEWLIHVRDLYAGVAVGLGHGGAQPILYQGVSKW